MIFREALELWEDKPSAILTVKDFCEGRSFDVCLCDGYIVIWPLKVYFTLEQEREAKKDLFNVLAESSLNDLFEAKFVDTGVCLIEGDSSFKLLDVHNVVDLLKRASMQKESDKDLWYAEAEGGNSCDVVIWSDGTVEASAALDELLGTQTHGIYACSELPLPMLFSARYFKKNK